MANCGFARLRLIPRAHINIIYVMHVTVKYLSYLSLEVLIGE